MDGGPLPPVPDLIPIAALLKSSPSSNNCSPYSTYKEVMGEQRSRRTGKQPAIDLIDSAQSRGSSAAPQAPSRKARSERHRKSERRRVHRGNRRRSNSKQRASSSPERPANPRVNPIFVWVRQVDTRIVDVKCEDYDKRNRILLTKTAQGWRAIPRTETLVPNFREAADRGHHRVRKSRKSGKIKKKSTAVQVDESMHQHPGSSPTWTAPVNIESHLPSHTIHVPKNRPASPEEELESNNSSVNSELSCSAQTPNVKCSASKVCDVSPLDNLLAVAELEFNHQIQTGEWNKSTGAELPEVNECMLQSFNDMPEESKEYLENIANLNKLIDSCTNEHEEETTEHTEYDDQKTEDCDYTEDDDNNLAMDDILSRLEQSLRSPETTTECNSSADIKPQSPTTEPKPPTEITKENYEPVPDSKLIYKESETTDEKITPTNNNENIVESSTTSEDIPTDLTITRSNLFNHNNNCDDLVPTDLSIPKTQNCVPLIPRPPSQNSETIQSPQPSGIPAVPPSPDIYHNVGKNKNVFADSHLPGNGSKVSSNSDAGAPLDLGKSRKSASPTVSCSEEVKINSYLNELEPLSKKFKSDITLKTLLSTDLVKDADDGKRQVSQQSAPQTPRLLELLTSEAEVDALTQLKQLLMDKSLNVPDPMLVPKEKLSQLLLSPAREIPRLLKQRPELRLPEALAFPHLLQDPDILVITLAQLETIIAKQCQPLPLKEPKDVELKPEKSNEIKKYLCEESTKDGGSKPINKTRTEDERPKNSHRKEDQSRGGINELANDIDAATNAAFNHMMWLPYLSQLEAAAMSVGGTPEFLKVLNSVMPMYQNPPPVPDLSHLFNAARLPPPIAFPMQPPMNYPSLDCAMWQEAMAQANMLRPRNPFDAFTSKQNFRDYSEQVSGAKKPQVHQKMSPPIRKGNTGHPYYMPNAPQNMHNPFMSPQNHSNSLQIPPFSNAPHQKNSYQPRKTNQNFVNKNQYPKYDANAAYHNNKMANAYQQHANQRHLSYQQNLFNQRFEANNPKGKVACKSFANSYQKTCPTKRHEEITKLTTTQPIDLSGCANMGGGKLKVKQHLIDQSSTPKLLKYDDNTPEVGSTTASIEEMQDAQKHLWHPLFGNQKGYTSPWNWTTVTATGE